MLKRILGIGFILLIANISFAQDTATFVSSYEGNLTFDYPAELVASDYDAEFLIVVSREDVNPSSTLEEGQAALIFLTPQGLSAAGMSATDADGIIEELMGEIPSNAEQSTFVAEYGDGIRIDFQLPDLGKFVLVGFDRDDVPLLAVIGTNQAPQEDLDMLIDVVRTARYTSTPEESDSDDDTETALVEVVRQLDGYSFAVPADWQESDISFLLPESNDVVTVLLINRALMEGDDEPINFETVIQGELELLSEEFADDTVITVEDGEPIDDFPTQEVHMTLTHDDTIDYDYRFVLVDFGDEQVLLSAVYSEDLDTTESYLPTLRAIAESFHFVEPLAFEGLIEHAGLRVQYPAEYTVNTNIPNLMSFTSDIDASLFVEIANPTQTAEWYPEVTDGSAFGVAQVIAESYELDDDAIVTTQLENGQDGWQFSTEDEFGKFTLLTMETEDGVILLSAIYTDASDNEMETLLQTIASNLEMIED